MLLFVNIWSTLNIYWLIGIQIYCQQIQMNNYSVTFDYLQYSIQHLMKNPEGKRTTICCYLVGSLWIPPSQWGCCENDLSIAPMDLTNSKIWPTSSGSCISSSSYDRNELGTLYRWFNTQSLALYVIPSSNICNTNKPKYLLNNCAKFK